MTAAGCPGWCVHHEGEDWVCVDGSTSFRHCGVAGVVFVEGQPVTVELNRWSHEDEAFAILTGAGADVILGGDPATVRELAAELERAATLLEAGASAAAGPASGSAR